MGRIHFCHTTKSGTKIKEFFLKLIYPESNFYWGISKVGVRGVVDTIAKANAYFMNEYCVTNICLNLYLFVMQEVFIYNVYLFAVCYILFCRKIVYSPCYLTHLLLVHGLPNLQMWLLSDWCPLGLLGVIYEREGVSRLDHKLTSRHSSR